jgi:hypothetical protein
MNGPACLSIPKKLALLEEIRLRQAEKSQAWVEASLQGKQMLLHAPEAGEEWTGGPWYAARSSSPNKSIPSPIASWQPGFFQTPSSIN